MTHFKLQSAQNHKYHKKHYDFIMHVQCMYFGYPPPPKGGCSFSLCSCMKTWSLYRKPTYFALNVCWKILLYYSISEILVVSCLWKRGQWNIKKGTQLETFGLLSWSYWHFWYKFISFYIFGISCVFAKAVCELRLIYITNSCQFS